MPHLLLIGSYDVLWVGWRDDEVLWDCSLRSRERSVVLVDFLQTKDPLAIDI